MNSMNYEDIYVVDTFEEAEQFKYCHNDEPVEVGTAVGYDVCKIDPITKQTTCTLHCFEGVYFDDQN
jgi:hypothetical protein